MLTDVLGNALREAFGPTAAAFALAAIGLNIHYGYTGLLNFGHVGFMLLGAYGLAVTVATFGGSFWLGVVVSIVLAAAFALLLGVPTLRLRADYLAITTIAAAEILRLAVRSSAAVDLTGGPFGRQSIAGTFFNLNPFPSGRFGIGVLEYSSTQLWAMVVTWVLVALGVLFTFLLMRSPWGRVLKSIREDEDAARSLGKNVFSFKMQSLVIGGIFGGLGGMMFAIAGQTANADSYLPVQTFFLYVIVILGGAATAFGPVVGAMLFFFLRAGLDAFLRSDPPFIPSVLTQGSATGATVVALVGIGLVLLMTYRPQGIFGSRREMTLDL
jgi:branched-chain amino acid transport system permease protein